MQIMRKRTMLLVIPVGLLALAMGLWWLLSDSRQAAQAVSTNACTADEAYYIATVVSSDYGEVTVRMRTEVSPSALRVVFSDPSGNVKAEKIRVGDATEQQRAAMGAVGSSSTDPALIPANFTRHAANATIYYRELEDGTWTEWVSEREELDNLTDGPGFCGSPMSELTGLTRVGTESVDGVSTTKYTATVEFDGDITETGPLDLRLDWWVDSEGRLKRKSRTQLANNSKDVVTYSDFGQANDITIPETTSNLPSEPVETATPTPELAATATPEPPSTSTPAPEPTDPPAPPAATATPEPATATPEPATATPEPATATPEPGTPTSELATPTPVPLGAPPVPSGLAASASGADSVALSWTALTGASHYGVYRYFPASSELPAFWGKVSENVPEASYTVTGLDCETEYHYGIAAHGDGVTYSASWGPGFSDPVAVTTGACPGPGT